MQIDRWLDEMTEGYLDGSKDDRVELPDSLSNRSASYRHGWLNGRDDRLHSPRVYASRIRRLAQQAMDEDEAASQLSSRSG